MTVSFERSDMAKTICRACKANQCQYEWNGNMFRCPFHSSTVPACEVGQFSPDEIRALYEIIIMKGFYKKGKKLP